jgi:hypothetical protein
LAFPLYDDEDAMNGIVLRLLLDSGADCLTTNQAGNVGMPDDQQLAFATAEGRAIVTYNRRDFQRLHGQWANAGRPHAGIIILTNQRFPASVLHAKLQRERDSTQMVNAILYLSPSLDGLETPGVE